MEFATLFEQEPTITRLKARFGLAGYHIRLDNPTDTEKRHLFGIIENGNTFKVIAEAPTKRKLFNELVELGWGSHAAALGS